MTFFAILLLLLLTLASTLLAFLSPKCSRQCRSIRLLSPILLFSPTEDLCDTVTVAAALPKQPGLAATIATKLSNQTGPIAPQNLSSHHCRYTADITESCHGIIYRIVWIGSDASLDTCEKDARKGCKKHAFGATLLRSI